MRPRDGSGPCEAATQTSQPGMQPYYADEAVTLYHGDCRDVLPTLDVMPDLTLADPPYGSTALDWDRWVDGWPQLVPGDQMWCFGTFRMFLEHAAEFAGWSFGQDVVWEKHNGTGAGDGRFLRVHETVAHFYRGKWGDRYYEPQREQVTSPDKSGRRLAPAAAHRRPDRTSAYVDDGTRLVRSVIKAPSVRYERRNETEKPLRVVETLIAASCPPGGLVFDPFAGSGTTLLAARNSGRRAIGIEKREAQCAITVARLAQQVLATAEEAG